MPDSPPGRHGLLNPHHVHPHRSLVLLALGALTGIGIAGYGLFTARGTRIQGVPPEDVALVNQRPILRSDYVTQLQNLYTVPFAQSTPAQRRRVLDDMLAEELMVQRGLEVDLPSFDPEVRAALVAGVELQLFADVLAQRPTDAQLRAYYAAHRSRYVRDGIMRLRDLVADRPADATAAAPALRAALAAGRPLDPLLQRFGLRDSRRLLDSGHVDTGDIFDFAARAHLAPAVFAVASGLASGQVSAPVATADGTHLVVMVRREPPQQRSYEDAANDVWRDLNEDAKRRVRDANLQYLRSKADIQLAPDMVPYAAGR